MYLPIQFVKNVSFYVHLESIKLFYEYINTKFVFLSIKLLTGAALYLYNTNHQDTNVNNLL